MRNLVIFLLTLLLAGCLKPIPYAPGQVESFVARQENLRLEFSTDKGRQVAFYVAPRESPERPPKKIAILYPGINSVALDWLPFVDLESDPALGYLLIDYPGRGLCEGTMHPEENYRNTEGALRALAAHWGLPRVEAELELLGHSFGTGAALQFATRQPVERIVLVAPFTTLRRATARKSLFLALVMPAQIDNRQLIRSLLASDAPPRIAIFHGSADDALPVAMGRELAALAPAWIAFREFPEDGHSDILRRRWPLIFRALAGRPTLSAPSAAVR